MLHSVTFRYTNLQGIVYFEKSFVVESSSLDKAVALAKKKLKVPKNKRTNCRLVTVRYLDNPEYKGKI